MEKEVILLKEYELCQQLVRSNSQQYFQIVGIFMVVITAVLGGLIYGVISSELSSNFFQKSVSPQVIIFSSIIIFLGFAIIIILISLKRWLKRVIFLNDINYGRIREIEADLGIWQSWRIHGVDHWQDSNFDNQISDEMKVKLINYQPCEWWQHWRTAKRYAPRRRYIQPSRYGSYDLILWTLMSIWGLSIIAAVCAIIFTTCL